MYIKLTSLLNATPPIITCHWSSCAWYSIRILSTIQFNSLWFYYTRQRETLFDQRVAQLVHSLARFIHIWPDLNFNFSPKQATGSWLQRKRILRHLYTVRHSRRCAKQSQSLSIKISHPHEMNRDAYYLFACLHACMQTNLDSRIAIQISRQSRDEMVYECNSISRNFILVLWMNRGHSGQIPSRKSTDFR